MEEYDRWLKDYSEDPEYPQVILAKDAEIGKKYLVSNHFKAFTIHKINRNDNADIVTSVSVLEDDMFSRIITISGNTELIPFSEKWFSKRLFNREGEKERGKDEKKIKEEKLGKKVKRSLTSKTRKISRASIMDTEFMRLIKEGNIPDWNEIVELVIKSGAVKENTERRLILSQAKTRYKWCLERSSIFV